ncbi:hypothetical protein LLH00_08275 [bacterium]|nr:hypothetical protein [bacterium]
MRDSLKHAVCQLRRAAGRKKCPSCGCFHGTLLMIEDCCPPESRPATLDEALQLALGSRQPVTVDCNGCKHCKPMDALLTLRGMR